MNLDGRRIARRVAVDLLGLALELAEADGLSITEALTMLREKYPVQFASWHMRDRADMGGILMHGRARFENWTAIITKALDGGGRFVR